MNVSPFRPFALLLVLLANAAAQDRGEFDEITDDQLRALRDQKIAGLRESARSIHPIQTADGVTYSGIFFCTLYYTPKESGFTAERGFDATSVTAPGLRGRKYPRDFLRAVKKEGFGRMRELVGEYSYLRWIGGNSFTFATTPVGRRGEVLVPQRSCAISSRNKFLRQHSSLLIKSPDLESEIANVEWMVCDTGPALHPLQIDLYWGEDEPRGAIGRQRARPRGTSLEYAFKTEVTVKN